MMSKCNILILSDQSEHSGSVISWLAQCWNDTGYGVIFSDHLSAAHEADIAIVHVDATDVPTDYLSRARVFPTSINGSCASISKDLFSSNILKIDSDYSGQVIVKTLANYGGLPEFQRMELSRYKRKIAELSQRIALSERPATRPVKSWAWKNLQTLDPSNYPRFASTKDVPRAIWKNKRLTAERFKPEKMSDGRYVLRHWYFLGDREFCRTLICKSPIPKWASMDDDERDQSRAEWFEIDASGKADVPPEIRRVREALKMDFGRIDWAIHNGEPVAFDANKTPAGLGSICLESELGRRRYEVMRQFSEGIADFL